jgi:hypothetical protein
MKSKKVWNYISITLLIICLSCLIIFTYFNFITRHAPDKMAREFVKNTFIHQEYNGVLVEKEFFSKENATIKIKTNDSSVVVYKIKVKDNREFIEQTNINDSIIKLRNSDSIRVIPSTSHTEKLYKLYPLSGSK